MRREEFIRCYRIVSAFALRLTSDVHAAEDIAQETLIAYHKQAFRIRKPIPWMLETASRKCAKRVSRQLEVIDLASDLEANPGADLELIDHINRSLSDDEAAALTLIADGATIDEVATDRRLTYDQSRTLIKHARRRAAISLAAIGILGAVGLMVAPWRRSAATAPDPIVIYFVACDDFSSESMARNSISPVAVYGFDVPLKVEKAGRFHQATVYRSRASKPGEMMAVVSKDDLVFACAVEPDESNIGRNDYKITFDFKSTRIAAPGEYRLTFHSIAGPRAGRDVHYQRLWAYADRDNPPRLIGSVSMSPVAERDGH
ncbi:MAG: sigma-70 family RNA polymerase sigma factor [Planctomycetota bacterium]